MVISRALRSHRLTRLERIARYSYLFGSTTLSIYCESSNTKRIIMAPLSQATSPPEMVAGEKMPARGRSAQQPQVSAQPSSHPPSHNQGATPTRSRERTSWLTRLKEFSRTFYKQRDFVYLALLAGVMIIINIVQVALIKYLHSWGWIVGFPASVFGFSILLLLARALLNWKELVDTWKNIDCRYSLPSGSKA